LHDLVAGLHAACCQSADLRFDIIHGEANVVEPHLVELEDVRIDNRLRVTISQQLDFETR